MQLSASGSDGSLPSAEIQHSVDWDHIVQLCPHHRGAASLEPATYRHSGFQALGNVALLTSDQQGPGRMAQGMAATDCFLRGLYILPCVNKPATLEAGTETVH